MDLGRKIASIVAALALALAGVPAPALAESGRYDTQSQLSPADDPVNTSGKFTYRFEGEAVDMWVGDGADHMKMLPDGKLSEKDVTYYYSGTGKVTIRLSTLFITKVTSITVNGTSYNNQIPTTQEDKLAHFTNQHTEFDITVDKADAYVIETTTARDDDPAVGNFLWSYREEDKGKDDYMDHGRIEFVSAVYGGETYTADKLEQGTAFDWSENGEGDGGAVFPAGTTLTVRLIPEHGMQLVSFGPNGETFETGEETAVYTFEVAKGNFHLGARFAEVDDVVVSKSDAIAGGAIELSNEDVPSGSAALYVSDSEISPAEQAGLEAVVAAEGDYEVMEVVDLSLDQLVYKGTDDPATAWTASLGHDEDLKQRAAVALTIAEDQSVTDAIVVHEENGTWVPLETYFDPESNSAVFATRGFSNYAIATIATPTESVYRLYNPYSGEHFYTTSAYEYEQVQKAGWNDEGVAWSAPAKGGESVYRLYNPYGGDHHYTTSINERDCLMNLGWNYEGIAFYGATEDDSPVARLYNPYSSAGAHLFTMSEFEANAVEQAGWIREGTGWYALA